jgi:hypothetical protein
LLAGVEGAVIGFFEHRSSKGGSSRARDGPRSASKFGAPNLVERHADLLDVLSSALKPADIRLGGR